MLNELYKLLNFIIPISYISVINTPLNTMYSFSYVDPDGAVTSFVLTSEYSHTDGRDIYAKYTLFVDGIMVCSVLNRFPHTKAKGLQTQPSNNMAFDIKTARQMEVLLKMCSKKVVAQEMMGQRMHMLKTLINEQNAIMH